MFTHIQEKFKTRVLLAPQTTATGAGGYLAPTAGVRGLTIRSVAKMGNAADLVLTLYSADDASGTNPVAWPNNVPIYVNNVRVTDAKAYTVGDATGNFIVDFVIDPATIPAGKTLGVAYGNSNAANLVASTLIEALAYCPEA